MISGYFWTVNQGLKRTSASIGRHGGERRRIRTRHVRDFVWTNIPASTLTLAGETFGPYVSRRSGVSATNGPHCLVSLESPDEWDAKTSDSSHLSSPLVPLVPLVWSSYNDSQVVPECIWATLRTTSPVTLAWLCRRITWFYSNPASAGIP